MVICDQFKKNPYNEGDKYEDLIFKCLKTVDKVAEERGGASSAQV